MSLIGFTEDQVEDARRDAAYEEAMKDAVECADCGLLYSQGAHPATRYEPAWADVEECPRCGCGEIKW